MLSGTNGPSLARRDAFSGGRTPVTPPLRPPHLSHNIRFLWKRNSATRKIVGFPRARSTWAIGDKQMLPIALCLAFSAAQFAVCAPVPRDSMDSRDRISDREHDATPSSAWLVDNDHQGGAPAPNGENPQMLPRPKTHQLSLLRPLARHRMPNGETHRDPENDVMRLPHHVHDEHEHGHDHFGPPDLNSVGPPQPGMPCYQGQASHDRNDMLIVYLAAAFMVVVVVMEAWGGAFRRQALASHRQWSIRCQDHLKMRRTGSHWALKYELADGSSRTFSGTSLRLDDVAHWGSAYTVFLLTAL
ncbi:predicted protein [Chaetomium globosum CBS 148.51]|uniref:Copper transporter n=1 Tax=Chaetomium globosum (strain ATCC 6205 / CBS 148.51 / DSM 1962 / NBRC 6347 / NRRL 1970) TaxID=306901 RepID=Q2H4L8_CHAGB|nr:uncharacterized protein CHGG_06397 [Chaetomium globosum CBS 148.51]EAQ89778.1 predicted protein [Chaetomium globosum CBS 148.51]